MKILEYIGAAIDSHEPLVVRVFYDKLENPPVLVGPVLQFSNFVIESLSDSPLV